MFPFVCRNMFSRSGNVKQIGIKFITLCMPWMQAVMAEGKVHPLGVGFTKMSTGDM